MQFQLIGKKKLIQYKILGEVCLVKKELIESFVVLRILEWNFCGYDFRVSPTAL